MGLRGRPQTSTGPWWPRGSPLGTCPNWGLRGLTSDVRVRGHAVAQQLHVLLAALHRGARPCSGALWAARAGHLWDRGTGLSRGGSRSPHNGHGSGGTTGSKEEWKGKGLVAGGAVWTGPSPGGCRSGAVLSRRPLLFLRGRAGCGPPTTPRTLSQADLLQRAGLSAPSAPGHGTEGFLAPWWCFGGIWGSAPPTPHPSQPRLFAVGPWARSGASPRSTGTRTGLWCKGHGSGEQHGGGTERGWGERWPHVARGKAADDPMGNVGGQGHPQGPKRPSTSPCPPPSQ